MYTVITENDKSQWNDETGVLYHFPKRYLKFLQQGTDVIYYKGKLKDPEFKHKRLSAEPHYFAKAQIHAIYPDPENLRDEYHYAVISSYTPFSHPVIAKIGATYLEQIPPTKEKNYWRDGVRPIDKSVYESILTRVEYQLVLQNDARYGQLTDSQGCLDIDLESAKEGNPKLKFVTTYERNPVYRKAALLIHGYHCKACGFEFGSFYGEYAHGFIHVHHINPVSQLEIPTAINPVTDLVPVCANCHAVIHRRKEKTLTVDELREMIAHVQKSSKSF